MAYGGGIFLPSETAYKDPNRFRDVLEAEGKKEADYLSQMDQFFAQLEEMKRQFDVTAEMKDRQFEESLTFEREKLDWQSGENELDRSLRRYEIGETTRLGYATNEANKEIARAKSGKDPALEWAKFGLESEAQKYNISTNEFMKNLYLNQQASAKESHNILVNAVGGKAGTSGSSGVSGVSDSYYNPFGSKSISDYMDVESNYASIEGEYKQFGDWY